MNPIVVSWKHNRLRLILLILYVAGVGNIAALADSSGPDEQPPQDHKLVVTPSHSGYLQWVEQTSREATPEELELFLDLEQGQGTMDISLSRSELSSEVHKSADRDVAEQIDIPFDLDFYSEVKQGNDFEAIGYMEAPYSVDMFPANDSNSLESFSLSWNGNQSEDELAHDISAESAFNIAGPIPVVSGEASARGNSYEGQMDLNWEWTQDAIREQLDGTNASLRVSYVDDTLTIGFEMEAPEKHTWARSLHMLPMIKAPVENALKSFEDLEVDWDIPSPKQKDGVIQASAQLTFSGISGMMSSLKEQYLDSNYLQGFNGDIKLTEDEITQLLSILEVEIPEYTLSFEVAGDRMEGESHLEYAEWQHYLRAYVTLMDIYKRVSHNMLDQEEALRGMDREQFKVMKKWQQSYFDYVRVISQATEEKPVKYTASMTFDLSPVDARSNASHQLQFNADARASDKEHIYRALRDNGFPVIPYALYHAEASGRRGETVRGELYGNINMENLEKARELFMKLVRAAIEQGVENTDDLKDIQNAKDVLSQLESLQLKDARLLLHTKENTVSMKGVFESSPLVSIAESIMQDSTGKLSATPVFVEVKSLSGLSDDDVMVNRSRMYLKDIKSAVPNHSLDDAVGEALGKNWNVERTDDDNAGTAPEMPELDLSPTPILMDIKEKALQNSNRQSGDGASDFFQSHAMTIIKWAILLGVLVIVVALVMRQRSRSS